jgi:NAD(P)-dependent dehydrogenase (short-subunit alcohol dehydrogenase family)
MSRVAVVTGGGSGLGVAICQHLARQGNSVAVLDLNQQAAEAVAAGIRAAGGKALAGAVDVADRPSVDAAMGMARREFGPIAILVTSAAVAGFTPFEEITLDEWNRMLTINLTGTFNCAQSAIKDMVAANWGRIVLISSHAGQMGTANQAHYAASKGGVIALMKTLALEYARKGITVNTIPPFAVVTPNLTRWLNEGRLPPLEKIEQMIPAGRLGTPDDIAATCAFLCSDAASYITAQVISVNGGAVR